MTKFIFNIKHTVPRICAVLQHDKTTQWAMDWMIGSLLCLVAFLIRMYIFLRPAKHRVPPGPRPLPFLGNIILLARAKSVYREFQRLRDEYGDIFSLQVGPFRAVVINGYDLIHEAFVQNADITIARPKMFFRAMQGERKGIVFQDGHPWRSLRRFTLSTLRDLGLGKKTVEDTILEESAALNNEVEKLVGTEWHDPKALMTMATSNVICHLVFGSRFEYENDRFQEILRKMRTAVGNPRAFDLTTILPFYTYLEKFKIVRPMPLTELNGCLRNLVHEKIREHKKTYDSDNIRDYVDMYLKVSSEGNEDIGEEDMFGGIMDLFLAGSETSATTLSWSLLYMMEFPQIQKRCQQEIDQVVGRNRQVRMDDKINLPYTDATANEIQRYSSIVVIPPPHRTTEDMQLGGYHIHKNTMIMANLYSALRDHRYWSDPDTFNPEHFLDDNGKIMKPSGYVPFSAGPRVCLGESLAKMEIFLFFANLMQQFSFSKVSQQDTWLDKEVSLFFVRSPVPYRIMANLQDG